MLVEVSTTTTTSATAFSAAANVSGAGNNQLIKPNASQVIFFIIE